MPTTTTDKARAEGVADACETAVNAYLLARTYAESMRERVDEIGRAILAESPIMATEEMQEHGAPERITEPRNLYLADLKSAAVADYYAECTRRQLAAGVKPASMPEEHCPACVAEGVQIDAEWLLIEIGWGAIGQTGDEWKNIYGEKRERFIDLLCRLVVNRPGYRNPLTGKAA